MATVKIVPKEHWDVLREYLSTPYGGVVLIQENVLEHLSEEQKVYLRENDGGDVDYSFGGEADLWVECVTTKDHYFFSSITPVEE